MIEQITPADLPRWIAQMRANGQEPVVLDVREPWEWKTASVQADGFELVRMNMASIPVRLGELPADRPIACLCHHGGRSQQVAHFLANQGFAPVVNLAGGIDAWSRQVDPAVPRY